MLPPVNLQKPPTHASNGLNPEDQWISDTEARLASCMRWAIHPGWHRHRREPWQGPLSPICGDLYRHLYFLDDTRYDLPAREWKL